MSEHSSINPPLLVTNTNYYLKYTQTCWQQQTKLTSNTTNTNNNNNMYPWKRQTIDTSRGPVGSYKNLRKPLDKPPNGMEWQWDVTHPDKWILKRISDTSNNGDETNETASTDTSNTSDIKNDEDLLVPEDPKNINKSKNTRKQQEEKVLVEGVDYLKHTVLPNVDTFQGLCLKYRIKAVELRRANGGFSGTNLRLAPSVLIIPLIGHPDRGKIRAQDKNCIEYKIHTLLAAFPTLRHPEAKAYLELANGNLDMAMKEAKDDLEWEKQQQQKQQQRPEKQKPQTYAGTTKKQSKRHEGIRLYTGIPVAMPVDDSKTSSSSSSLSPPSYKEIELKPLLHHHS